MKKSVLISVLAAITLMSGCSGVSQESYNSLVAENENLKRENDLLKSENESLSISNKASEGLLTEYSQEIFDLKKQLKEHTNEDSLISNSNTSPNIQVYDDEFINVSFCGIEKCAEFSNRESVTFLIENKTDVVLTFFPVSVSFDGIDVGHLTNYDSISPQSKGKIYFIKSYDDEKEFENKSPSIISGGLLVRDMNNTGVFGERKQYEFSFANVSVL